MARIEISPQSVTGNTLQTLSYRMMGPTQTNTNSVANGSKVQLFSNYYSMQGTSSGGSFMILSGPMPADVNNIGTIPGSNLLLAWGPENNISTNVVTVGEVATINLPFIAASASGTATWFYLKTHAWNTNVTNILNSPQIHGIIGTVGEIGSGADLEISSTNIGSGNQYRLVNFKLAFPSYLDY